MPGKSRPAKQVYEEQDEERAKAAIAQFIDEIMLTGTLYIIGAGTTTEAIARRLGIKKTLLGVDAIRDRMPVAADCDEKTLIRLVEKYPDAGSSSARSVRRGLSLAGETSRSAPVLSGRSG